MRVRFNIILCLVVCGFVGVIARLAYLQLWSHNWLEARANNQSVRWVREAPRRGPILDRNGLSLTECVRVASCYADPKMVRGIVSTSRRLSGVLGMDAGAIAGKIQNANGSFVWLKRFLPVDAGQSLEKARLPGIGVSWEYRRFYPNGNLASNLLGMVGMDGHGLSGVEMTYDEWLVDTRPPTRSLRDGRGAGVSAMPSTEEASPMGFAQLTLDRTLQFIAERELDWGMKRSGAKNGLVLVQDPWTGEVLALASRPNLNLMDAHIGKTEELLIPAVHWVYEPGSVFKVITAAAALEENLVGVNEIFNCENGAWRYSGVTINDHEPESMITFAQVMERSSNIGFAKVGLRIGKAKLYDYIRAFGLGSLTGSEIPGESAGLLRPPAKWSGLSLPIISFGQEVGVTPLQMAAVYSAVANGGQLLEPRLFTEIKNQWGESKTWKTPSVVRQVVSRRTAETLKKLLQGVVTRGTGQYAQLDGWSTAGKTGTAQKQGKGGGYSTDKYVASFCGFVPAQQPRLTIVVIFDEPKGVSWGGFNAGPVFRNVAWHAMTYLGIPSDKPTNVVLEGARKNSAI